MEIVTSWMEQGMREERMALVIRLLTRRLGEVTPQLHDRIQSLSLAQLGDLAEALLDFTSTEDLEAWLSRQ